MPYDTVETTKAVEIAKCLGDRCEDIRFSFDLVKLVVREAIGVDLDNPLEIAEKLVRRDPREEPKTGDVVVFQHQNTKRYVYGIMTRPTAFVHNYSHTVIESNFAGPWARICVAAYKVERA